MKKLLQIPLILVTLFLNTISISAQDFNIDGIYYNITSKENCTVEVSNQEGGGYSFGNTQSCYSGTLIIPEYVTYNGTTYTVKALSRYMLTNSHKVTSVVIPASIDTIKACALRLIYDIDSNGEIVPASRNIPKITINYGKNSLYCSNAAISADSITINRDLKFYDTESFGKRIIWDSKYIEFGDSISVIPCGLADHNANLKEIKFPNTPFCFEPYYFNEYQPIGIFQSCESLEKINLSNLVPSCSINKWTDIYGSGGMYDKLNNLNSTYFIPPLTFKECSALKEVILPDSIIFSKDINIIEGINNHFIGSEAFMHCISLKNIKFPFATCDNSDKSSLGLRIGGNAFANSGLISLTLPSYISLLDRHAFRNCNSLEQITFPNILDWYILPGETSGIYESKYNSANLSNSKYSPHYYLRANLFENCIKLKTIDFGYAITVLPPNVFNGCKIEDVFLNNITDLQSGNFASPNLKTLTISNKNSSYKIEDNILKSIDSKNWILTTGKNYNGSTKLNDNIVENIETQLFEGLPIESFNLPNLKTIGKRAFANTDLKSITIMDSIEYGAEAFADCIMLKDLSIVPSFKAYSVGLFKNCVNITTPHKFHSSIKTIPEEIFYGTGITEFSFGEKTETINESAMPNGTTNITLFASIPPTVTETDSVEYISNTTLVVPSSCIDTYSAHKFWGKAKNIIKNDNYPGNGWSGYIVPMPDGLYFAKKDGNICYYDQEKGIVIDTHVPAGNHTFQLASWHGAIYGVNAGEQYTYINDANNTLGDGELYVVNKRSNNGFSKSTIVNNKNYGDGGIYYAFMDPYHILINDDNIYYTCRNSSSITANGESYTYGGVKILPAKELYAPTYESSFSVENFVCWHFLPYYTRGISYGAIPAGIQRDSQGVYWLALNYSGNGIFRFKQSDIYPTSVQAAQAYNPYPIIASGIEPTAIFLDEKNDYVYIFSSNADNHGVYRSSIKAIRNGGVAKFPSEWELIDNSIASPENSTTEEKVCVRQFTSDGKYVYWAYIAEENSGNKSGIKRVNATESPKVEYVVANVDAYGVCYYKYDGKLGVEDVKIDKNANLIEVVRYDIHGRLLNEPTKGINIVKYSDGTTKKEIVK